MPVEAIATLTPGERRRVTPAQAKYLIRGARTISVNTCFGKWVKITKQAAFDLLDEVPDETVALRREETTNYQFLYLTA